MSLTPTPEAREAVAKRQYERARAELGVREPGVSMPAWDELTPADRLLNSPAALGDIAAFVEAEGLTIQTVDPGKLIKEWVGNGEVGAQRLVGPWRKRD